MQTDPWWKNQQIAAAIGFRAMLISCVVTLALLSFWMIRGWTSAQTPSLQTVINTLRDSFVGCAAAGIAAGFVLGVPLGIVHVLATRARLMDLEQDVENR